jgi:uncharacterized protein YceK
MQHKFHVVCIALLLAVFGQGCGTTTSHFAKPADGGDRVTGIYRGVKYDGIFLHTDKPNVYDPGFGYGVMLYALVICDTPISAVGDTLLLPFDASNNGSKKQQPEAATH